MQQRDERKLAALSSYLSMPKMQNTQAILAETGGALIRSMKPCSNMALLVTETGHASLLDVMEDTHGPQSYLSLNLHAPEVIRKIEAPHIDRKIQARVYRHTILEYMQNTRSADFFQLAIRAGNAQSRILMRILLEELDPTPDNLIDILLEVRVTESQAFRKQSKFIARTYRNADFAAGHVDRLVNTAIHASNLRALAIGAKIGLGRNRSGQNPDIASQKQGSPFASIMSGLSSSHGRTRLARDLPELEDLIQSGHMAMQKNLSQICTTT